MKYKDFIQKKYPNLSVKRTPSSELYGEGDAFMDRLEGFNQTQLWWYLSEIFIDRNLKWIGPEERPRTPNVFDESATEGEFCQSTDYIFSCGLLYVQMLHHLFEKKTLLNAESLIHLWKTFCLKNESDFYEIKRSLTEDKTPWVLTYGYTLMTDNPLDSLLEIRNIPMLLADKNRYPHNHSLATYLNENPESTLDKTNLDIVKYFLFVREFGRSASSPDAVLNSFIPEMQQLINQFETQIKTLKNKEAIASCILDFTTDFEFHHFFPDGNGRMRLIMEHYLFLREGMTPIFPYNTGSMGLDWKILTPQGRQIILDEARLAMGQLLKSIQQQQFFNEQWALTQQPLTLFSFYQTHLNSLFQPESINQIAKVESKNQSNKHSRGKRFRQLFFQCVYGRRWKYDE